MSTVAKNTEHIVNKKSNNKYKKRKTWWDKEMDKLHQDVCIKYRKYKNSNFQDEALKLDLKTSKTKFRKVQRTKTKEKMEQSILNIDKLAKFDRIKFWREIKKLQNNRVETDLKPDSLKKNFEKLFTEKLINNEIHDVFVREKLDQLNDSQITDDYTIDKKIIEKILKNFNNGKSSGNAGVQAEMFKYGSTPVLVNIIKVIIEKIINLNIMPFFFNVGIIKPIVKDTSKDNNDAKNLRPITVSDCIANIYEKVIIYEIEKTHTNDDKQFGFKKNSSCSHAIFTLKETIHFNLKNKKKVYVCAIDASKAFDKVNRNFLWYKMINKTRPIILRTLIKYYKESLAYVQNNNEYSSIFKTTIGVKQGGPLSPSLFSIYMEDLIKEIEILDEGAEAYGLKVDILLYADDIVLVSNTKEGLQKMLDVTQKYGNTVEVKYNPDKTVYMIFGQNKLEKMLDMQNQTSNPTFDGIRITRVESMRYLGVIIEDSMKNIKHLTTRRNMAYNAINKINKIGFNLPKISHYTKSILYKTHIRPVLMYGLETIALNKTQSKNLQILEASIIKRAMGLTKKAKTNDLLNAMLIDLTHHRIKLIKTSFLKRILENEYTSRLLNSINNKYIENPNSITKYSFLIEAKGIIGTSVNTASETYRKCIKKENEIRKSIKEAQETEKTLRIIKILNSKDKNKIEKELNPFKRFT